MGRSRGQIPRALANLNACDKLPHMTLNQQIDQLLERARYIRAIGPTTEDFMRWRDETDELLSDVVGDDHPLLSSYRDAIGRRQSLDAEGLQIHGPFGMAPRLIAAEAVLKTLIE